MLPEVPERKYESFWRREKALAPGEIRTRSLPARSLVTIPTELSQLLMFFSCLSFKLQNKKINEIRNGSRLLK
jgi:hypothetical protein